MGWDRFCMSADPPGRGVGGVRQFCDLEGPLNRAGLQWIGFACCGLSQALVTRTQNGFRTPKNEKPGATTNLPTWASSQSLGS